jgi:hypothetical protein
MDGIDSSSTKMATPLSPEANRDGHPQRADSLGLWGERPGGGAAGLVPVTNGPREALACAAFVLLAFAVCTVDALSILHDAARGGGSIPVWQPWTTEYTSLAGSIIALPIAIAAARFFRSARPPALRVGVVIAASFAFSLLHIGVMVGLRVLIWRLRDGVYGFDFGGDWLYEYRKDALSFAILFFLLLVAPRLPAWPRRERQPDAARSRICLADGRREIEVDPAELRAVRGGGNYVELILAGNRRRLIRTTLDAAEAALGAHGFRRTHRSWLVRLATVEGISRTAAGDFRLRLDDQLVVPLSRRSRTVLAELRDQLAEPLLL